MSDPIPGNPISQGSWNKITGTLTWLGGDWVLETPGGGHYRLWRYDSAANGTDPLPDASPIVEGWWQDFDGFRDLIYLGGDRVLTWVPGSLETSFQIWSIDRSTIGPLLTGDPIIQGSWPDTKIRYDGLYYLGRDRLLYLDASTGNYQLFRYDRTMSGSGDPLIALHGGTWATILDNNLSYLDGDRVLDWKLNSSITDVLPARQAPITGSGAITATRPATRCQGHRSTRATGPRSARAIARPWSTWRRPGPGILLGARAAARELPAVELRPRHPLCRRAR